MMNSSTKSIVKLIADAKFTRSELPDKTNDVAYATADLPSNVENIEKVTVYCFTSLMARPGAEPHSLRVHFKGGRKITIFKDQVISENMYFPDSGKPSPEAWGLVRVIGRKLLGLEAKPIAH